MKEDKRKKKAKRKYEYLCGHIYNSDKYKEQFLKAIENDLYDFAIILIWKTFMLFLYEKMYQISGIIGEEIFIQKWEGIFNQKPKHYRRENLYWPNEEKDDKILTFLGALYLIDSNFITQLRIIKQKRDISSHVSELSCNYPEVKNYLSELLKIVEKIQDCHIEEYLKKIEDINKYQKILSSNKDMEEFLNRLIESLRRASTFDDAQEIEGKILNLLEFFTSNQIEEVLEAVFQNHFPYSINQVLEASGGRATSGFLKKIFELPQNKMVKIGGWRDFYKKLFQQKYLNMDRTNVSSLYGWLSKKLEPTKLEKEINVEDTPF